MLPEWVFLSSDKVNVKVAPLSKVDCRYQRWSWYWQWAHINSCTFRVLSRYFPTGPQLQSITALTPVPNYTASSRRLLRSDAQVEPSISWNWSQVRRSTDCATTPRRCTISYSTILYCNYLSVTVQTNVKSTEIAAQTAGVCASLISHTHRNSVSASPDTLDSDAREVS